MTYNANYAYPNQGGPGMPGVPGQPQGATHPDDLRLPLYGASFGQAVKRYFKNYVNFNGRASRSEYWWVQLFVALVQLIPVALIIIGEVMVLGGMATAAAVDPYGSATSMAVASGPGMVMLIIGSIMSGIIGLALILPNLGLMWRRLHDANFAGPFFFLGFIPGVGSLILIVLALMPSKPEGQRFDR